MAESGIRLTHSSRAKFGAPESVARCPCTVQSQLSGRARNDSGDWIAMGSPSWRQNSQDPISPMS